MKFLSATEWLFYNLWTYNPSSNFNNPYVKVAGSLIFRWGKPYVFYSTDDKGRIYRVSKSKLDKDTIERQFQLYLRGSDRDAKADLDVQLMRVLPLDDSKSKTYKIEFDYLAMDSLHDELNSFNDKKLVQAFIRPKNSKNRSPSLSPGSDRGLLEQQAVHHHSPSQQPRCEEQEGVGGRPLPDAGGSAAPQGDP